MGADATTDTRTKQTRASIHLDYDRDIAIYTDHLRPDRSTDVEMPRLAPVDFLTTLIQTRHWNMKVGDRREVSVLFDDEFYELVITAEKIETVKSPWGKIKALRLVPRMEENPKGMFRRGGEVRVCVSQDGQQLPLRFEVKLKVGTALAILTKYEENAPSASASASASTPAQRD
ncbi:MAG: DUF3108 domain-containing protein [Candidatus Synoicihabitans palmerolidicus]|nr:DUF3108 domain-containing protein [Candidatus Synoicihabitans palmerolidicus]